MVWVKSETCLVVGEKGANPGSKIEMNIESSKLIRQPGALRKTQYSFSFHSSGSFSVHRLENQ